MTTPLTPQLRETIENTIRFLAVDAVERAGCGHPGAPMGLARPALELWARHLRFDPSDPAWPLRDRFVLSAGHASMLLYSLLHLFGYELGMDELENFRQLHSKTPGHPEYGHTPGVEVTTGPLGQGFSHGVGMALAARLTRSHFGSAEAGPGHHFIYGIVSDGDLMEGVSYEAASLAGHLGLGNLVYLYDDNEVTIDGPVGLAFSEDVARRFEAQGWHVQKLAGQDYEGLSRALEAARAETGRPSILITKTTIGYGSPHKAGLSKAHGEKLGEDEVRLTKQALDWPEEPVFRVPDEVRSWLAEAVAGKRAERAAADARLATWREANPERASAWDAARSRSLPADFSARLVDGMAGKSDATRKHSGTVLQKVAELAPWVVGGSADLTPSNNTAIQGAGPVGPAAETQDPFAGRYLHFGIREHAMAGVTNGIALDGTFQPYAGTFLIFSDYMRPAIRLAALMGVPSTFVFTHDSIFLGEDGPTHQPIEQLDALRAIPNLTLFRPADGVETAMAWSWALQRAQGPTLLALTRQGVPALEREVPFEPEYVWRGAYVVSDVKGTPDVVLLGTGSEVGLAVETAAKLHAEGISARVVSAPSLELFAAQDASWREAVLPRDVPVVAVEAARGGSLQALVGPRGRVYGISRFGASAPYKRLAEAFGFTPDALAKAVRAHLA